MDQMCSAVCPELAKEINEEIEYDQQRCPHGYYSKDIDYSSREQYCKEEHHCLQSSGSSQDYSKEGT